MSREDGFVGLRGAAGQKLADATKFEAFAPYQTALSAEDLVSWRHAIAQADQLSLSLYGMRVTSEPGKQVRQRIAAAVRLLDGTTEIEFFASKRWLGTTTGARFVVVGPTRCEFTNRWRASTAIFEAVGDDGSRAHFWEDVAFYRNGKVLLWTCTHERECVIYSASQLRAWDLQGTPAVLPRIEAERLAEDAQRDIALQCR